MLKCQNAVFVPLFTHIYYSGIKVRSVTWLNIKCFKHPLLINMIAFIHTHIYLNFPYIMLQVVVLNTMKEDSLEEELISVNWLRMLPSHISVQLPLCGQTLRDDFCLSLPCTSELGQFLAQMVSPGLLGVTSKFPVNSLYLED